MPDLIDLESKRRKISRISVDDDVQICDVPKATKKMVQCGIIKRIILKNLFCHEHLDIENFIPQLNLLQGANGSGKSSVVAGIIVGLGGTCKATDRGKNISSIIKNGKNTACIEIHLSNDGYNPYQKEKYGNKIIVERKLSTSGSSSYKIKSEHGGILSEKKDELQKILNKFNIQVDNPALVLSQERAKVFLSTTDSKLLFKFFTTSTQLKQWSDSITEISNEIESLKRLISNKKESMAYLKNDVEESKKKVKAMKSLEENRKEVEKLIREKAWAEVHENEIEKADLEKELLKIDKNFEKVKENIEKFASELKELKNKKKANDERVVTLSEKRKSLEREREEANTKVNDAKKIMRQRNNQKMDLQKEKMEREQDVAILREKLEKDNNETKVRWEQSHKELLNNIENLEKDISTKKMEITNERTHLENIMTSVYSTQNEYHHADLQKSALVSELERLRKECEGLKNQKENVTVFGPYMPDILDDIKRTNFKERKPIGPIGNHINVKDKYKEWSHIVEKVLFQTLSSFLVFCYEDLSMLRKIFDRRIPQGTWRPRITVCPFREKVHDVRRFETKTGEYSSMWSIIEVDNNQVANALLDQCQIESLLLIPDIDNAIKLMSEKNRVPQHCKKAMTLDGDTIIPDPDYRIYSGEQGKRSAKFLQVSVKDRIKDLKHNISSTSEEVKKSTKEVNDLKNNWDHLKTERFKSEDKIKTLEEQQRKLCRVIERLRISEVPAPPDVCQLKNDLLENEKLICDVDTKLNEVSGLATEACKEVKEAVKRLDKVEKCCDEINADAENYKMSNERTEELLRNKEKEINVRESFTTKIANKRNQIITSIEDKTKAIDRMINDLDKNGIKRIVVHRSKEEIEKELKNLESAIKKQQSALGDIVTLEETLQKKVANLVQLKKELDSQDGYLSESKKGIVGRKTSLHLAKKIYRSIMKHSFSQYITKRKLKGCMEIDYMSETLKIMTGKDTGSKNQELQSLKMLSGGERSFSTVSFVLALWDIVTSPIRIMDEFDVFMDIVSRKQCLDMITESVKDTVQYIMVSPLECPIESQKIRILRLDPPERGSFGGASQENDDDDDE